jgi:LAO/AO transport system kinase
MVLVEAVLAGERLALARLLSQIENDTSQGAQALNALFPHTGRAHLIGVTGAPGTGKSSLVNQLAYFYRHPPSGQAPRSVAVVAVDPSSPFTGGAVLGDRIRMCDLAGDPGVFIRSMAARGSLGGLANTTAGVVQAFDAAGYEIILIETVGAGQVEVDIARLAHTTLVVEAPGLGDDIQAIKAGILEIADILVVNKADRPGVELAEKALKGMLQLATLNQSDAPRWSPPILRLVATDGTGIPELAVAIAEHRQYLEQSGGWQARERTRLQTELDNLLRARLIARWQATLTQGVYQQVLAQLVARTIAPHQAVAILLNGGKLE